MYCFTITIFVKVTLNFIQNLKVNYNKYLPQTSTKIYAYKIFLIYYLYTYIRIVSTFEKK